MRPRKNANSGLRGQAMTEFLICASFVLLPLFLGISMLAKYIDMKQATVQAARYQAWEYTTWFAGSGEAMSGFDAVPQPFKNTARTTAETRRRFFSDPKDEFDTLTIRNNDADTGWQAAHRNRFWTDHKGTALYAGADGGSWSIQSSTSTPTIPIIGDVMNILFDIVDLAFSAIASLMSFIGSSVGFTAINTDGFAKSTASMAVASTPKFIDIRTMHGESSANIPGLGGSSLKFSTTAAVLSDGWNAGGIEHTYNQAGGTVPTVLLKELLTLPVMATIWDVIAILAPELRRCYPDFSLVKYPWTSGPDKGSLWLGHIDIDAVHPDRLSGGGTHSCDDAGRCEFEPNIPRGLDGWDCIP
jgi:hypothetical protein